MKGLEAYEIILNVHAPANQANVPSWYISNYQLIVIPYH